MGEALRGRMVMKKMLRGKTKRSMGLVRRMGMMHRAERSARRLSCDERKSTGTQVMENEMEGRGGRKRTMMMVMMMVVMMMMMMMMMMMVVMMMVRWMMVGDCLEMTGKKMMRKMGKRERAMACVSRRGRWRDLMLCCCLRHQPP